MRQDISRRKKTIPLW